MVSQVGGQVDVGRLYVTYVATNPNAINPGDEVTVIFDAIYYTQEPYLGPISHPVVGLQTATFLLSSDQTKEYPNVPLSPGAKDGEYQAKIQVPADFPTGPHLVYVKSDSLSFDVKGTATYGPVANTSSHETPDTSDLSEVEIREKPSFVTQLLSSPTDFMLLLLGVIIVVLLTVSLVARRKRERKQKRA